MAASRAPAGGAQRFRGLLGGATGYQQGRSKTLWGLALGPGALCVHSRTSAGPGEHWEALTSLLRLLLGLVLFLPGGENHSSDKTIPPTHIFSAQGKRSNLAEGLRLLAMATLHVVSSTKVLSQCNVSQLPIFQN